MDIDYIFKDCVMPKENITVFSDVIYITVPTDDVYANTVINSNLGLAMTPDEIYLNFDSYDYTIKVKTSYSAHELHKEFDKMGSTSNTFALLLYPSKTTHSFLD